VVLFLQTGLRVSELVNLKLSDVDFTSHEITLRQGKGRKDRVVPLVKQAEGALKAYLAVREAQPEYDEVFMGTIRNQQVPATRSSYLRVRLQSERQPRTSDSYLLPFCSHKTPKHDQECYNATKHQETAKFLP